MPMPLPDLSRHRRACEVGFVAPALIAIAFALDAGTRLLPTEWFTFRPQEALGRFPIAEGPYFPLHSVRMNRTYGDLANLGNLPSMRQYHAQTASSDELGFRNPPGTVSTGRVEVLLVGDSFSLGTGLSDWETLPAQLAVRGGVRVYSVATQSQLPALGQLLSMASRLRMDQGIVLVQLLERKDTPAASDLLASPPPVSSFCDLGKWARTIGSDLIHYSPLKILASRWQRSLQDDRVLPNPLYRNIVTAKLRNGQVMLFHRDEIRDEPPAVEISALKCLQRELAARNLHLAILLVPNKYTVYRHLLARGHPAPSEEALSRLDRALRDAGLQVIHPLPRLRQAAEAAFARRRYIYWLDDTHWNREGVAVVAAEVARDLAAPVTDLRAQKMENPAEASRRVAHR
ncbi:MAG: alginate O-acetyltransferase AlgX-related protein [Bryobacteraceae bacterium]